MNSLRNMIGKIYKNVINYYLILVSKIPWYL